MTHARRVESWIVLEDCTLPITTTMALQDIHLHVGDRTLQTRVTYKDGRSYETVASRQAIFRAMTGASRDTDAVTFEATIGTPRDLPEQKA